MSDQEASARTRRRIRPLYMAMKNPTTTTMTIRTMIRAITGSGIQFLAGSRTGQVITAANRGASVEWGRPPALLRGLKLYLHGFRARLCGRLKLPFINYPHGCIDECGVAA